MSSSTFEWLRRLDPTSDLIVSFPKQASKEKIPDPATFRRDLISSNVDVAPLDDSKIEKLFSEGADFLYGMLFDNAFELSPQVRGAMPEGLSSDRSYRSIALQQFSVSRSKQDASAEIQCLESVLKTSNPLISQYEVIPPCQIFVSSDRKYEPPARVTDWLLENKCSVWKANPLNGPDDGLELLHYFQDAALLSKARSAWIGYEQDAENNLILELIEYYRALEVWKLGRDPPLPTHLSTCILTGG